MKFRAKVEDILLIRQFSQILQTLSKSCKQLAVRITPDKLVFVLSERDSESHGVTAWCEFTQESYFIEYCMEGVTPEDNEIYLEVSSESLASTLSGLKSSSTVSAVKIKLTKKLVPCLTFEIESQTTNSSVECIHDIPVSIIGRRNWGEYQQPELPVFDVSLAMPDIKIVRRTLERLKNLGPKLTVTASNLGKLCFTVESYAVKSCVTYSDLRIFEVDNDAADENRRVSHHRRSTQAGGITNELNISATATQAGDRDVHRVEVDMKALLHVIPTEHLKPTHFICSIVHKRMLHIFYIFGDVTLQYCVPGVL